MRWLLLSLCMSCAAPVVVPLPPEARLHEAVTDDGWRLALTEYPAQGPVTGPPVLVCHGISANNRNVDLDDRHSLPRWLAAHGRSAWTVSLRGTGASDRPDASKGRGDRIRFEDFWRHDLPAAIRVVRATTGAATIDYVGHSMGGMIVYAFLAEGGEGIHAAVTLGSPTRLDFSPFFAPLIPAMAPVIRAVGTLPLEKPGAVLASLPSTGAGDFNQRLLYNPANVSPETWRRLNVLGVADTPASLLLELAPLVQRGAFQSDDGAIDYRRDMQRIRVPVLVAAGKADHLATVPAVRDGYRALGGPKQWLLIAEENGAQANYGHMDLVIGDRAPDEVWRPLFAFLSRQP